MNKPFDKAQGKQFLKDGVGWGIGLWLIGYALGILLFALVPSQAIGWIIMPIGIAVAFWVLFKKVNPVREQATEADGKLQYEKFSNGVKGGSFKYYVSLAITWTVIAVVFDYLFLVKALKPADGYYKLDVYLYYIITFILPLIAGWCRKNAETGVADDKIN